jgi:ribosomal protein L27
MTVRHFGMEMEGASYAKGAAYSHGEGRDARPSGAYSHAEGRDCESSGASSHAEGQTSIASGSYAHAEGGGSNASGASSHAEGAGSSASGAAAHSEGNITVASGAYSHAGGNRATASRHAQFARAGGTNQFSVLTQYSVYPIGAVVSSTAPTVLAFDGSGPSTSASGTTVLIVPYKSVIMWRLQIVGRRCDAPSSGASQGIEILGCAARDASGNARLVGTPITVANFFETSALATLVVDINTATTASNYVQFTVTNVPDVMTSWTGSLYTSELTTNG